MEALTTLTGILTLAGAVLSLALVVLLPRIKRSKIALTRATVAGGFVTFGFIVLAGLTYVKYAAEKPSASAPPATAAPSAPSVTAGSPPDTEHNSANAADKIVVKQTIEKTLVEHQQAFSPTTQTFEQVYPATPGYRIVDQSFVPRNSNGLSQLDVQQVANGAAVVVRFALTSGPQFDRYRAWVQGDLTLVQEKVPNSKALTTPAK